MAALRNYLLLVGLLLLIGRCPSQAYSKDDDLEVKILKMLVEELADESLNLGKRQSTCTAEYQELGRKAGVTQTMCQHEHSAATNKGVSKAQRQKILDFHNRIRSEVQPPAANMQKIYWHDELARMTQHYTNTCPNWHDQSKARYLPEFGTDIWVGQNIAQGQPDWNYVMTGWYNETKYYTYGREYSGLMSNGKAIGHYTQQIWATAAYIGCGYTDCPGVHPYSQYTDKNMFACNYIWGQSYDVSHPYRSSARMGDECPNHRNNVGLCDCGGLVCKDGGTIDVSTCSCKCPKLRGGKDCSTLVCPEEDLPSCEMYKSSRCTNDQWIRRDCPYKCGVCKPGDYKGDVTTTTVAPTEPPAPPSGGGKPAGQGQAADVNEINTGPNACPHVDSTACRGITEEYCKKDKYKKKCPNACKQCEPRCPGKGSSPCFNEGYLNDDCTCECPPDFGGDKCEIYENCPTVDYHQCDSNIVPNNRLVPKNCGSGSVWRRCPIMCGECPVVCPKHTPGDCVNGAVESDCQCHCEAGFTGPDCYLYVQCPVEKDDDSCDNFRDHLDEDDRCIDADIRRLCPYMCSACTKDTRYLRNLMRRSHILK